MGPGGLLPLSQERATCPLNKQSRTADKVWTYSVGVVRGANYSSP